MGFTPRGASAPNVKSAAQGTSPSSRAVAKECSPQPALSLSKGHKPWVTNKTNPASPGGAKEQPTTTLLSHSGTHPQKELPPSHSSSLLPCYTGLGFPTSAWLPVKLCENILRASSQFKVGLHAARLAPYRSRRLLIISLARLRPGCPHRCHPRHRLRSRRSPH